MADHKANQILVAIKAKLTGLASTGANVYQSRAYAIGALPAINIKLGSDSVQSIHNIQSDNELLIVIEVFVKSDESLIDSTILQIRKEVQMALMADETLGLSFVLSTLPSAMSAPEISSEEQTIAYATLDFKIIYRSLLTDPSG